VSTKLCNSDFKQWLYSTQTVNQSLSLVHTHNIIFHFLMATMPLKQMFNCNHQWSQCNLL